MWNAKRTNLFWAVCLACSIVIYFALLPSCRNKNEAVWMDYFVPPANETVAILLVSWHHRGGYFALFGDREIAEKRIGHPIETAKIFEGREWLEKIMDAYEIALKEGEKKEFSNNEHPNDGDIVFITPKRLYVRTIGINKDDNTICDRYMKSTLLKQYFDELGLTDDLLIGEPLFEINQWVPDNIFYVPQTDTTMAILLYLPNSRNLHAPLALFGNRKLTEEIVGESLKPRKIIEGHDWLEKIIDAYSAALKEAKEKKFPRSGDINGRIVFVTEKGGWGYEKSIGVDANTVYDRYMESGLLKQYFDELGLTKELLAGRPNARRKASQGSKASPSGQSTAELIQQ